MPLMRAPKPVRAPLVLATVAALATAAGVAPSAGSQTSPSSRPAVHEDSLVTVGLPSLRRHWVTWSELTQCLLGRNDLRWSGTVASCGFYG